MSRTFDARLRTRWLPHYHQPPMTPAAVTSPSTWRTPCFPLVEWVPRSKRPHAAQSWCAGPVVEAEMNVAWQQREEAWRHPQRRTPQHLLSKDREDGWKNLRKVRKTAVLNVFWDFVRKLETRTREGDQAGFCRALRDDEPGREASPQLGVRQR